MPVWYAASRAAANAINAPLSAVEQRNLDTLLAPARALLGDAAELSFQAGRSLNLSSALALALNDERSR
ncbi:MAG: hypothetical protein Fur005_25730 [Roseiflexaceae bacterium]